MIKGATIYIAIVLSLSIASCSSSNTTNQTTGDTGDSTSVGTGPDTTGSMVDTGSTVTDEH